MKRLAPVFAAALLAGCSTAERELMEDSPIQAARFRYQQRLSDDGAIPHNALLVAKAQRDAMPASGAMDSTWTWAGPGNIGGRLRAVIIHPTQANTMWIGAAGGGIWKTTNGGSLWAPLDEFIPSLAISCMAIDPANPDVLFAGTGEGGFFETVQGSSNTAAMRGAGIFKTTDGGATWNQIPSTAGPDWYAVNRIAIHPTNNQIMLAGTSTGIFRSTNGGTTWTQRTNTLAFDVSFNPNDPSKAVAGRHDLAPQYSLDGGITWLTATGAIGHRQELRYAASDPNIVYAAVSAAGKIKIHKSTDGGQSYTLTTTGTGINTYEAYNSVLWVDPTNPNTLVLGGVFLYRSTNSGGSFTQVFTSVHADMHVITHHPAFNGTTNKTVFFGTDGGIYRTTDVYATSATSLNNNVGVTQFYGGAVNNTSGVIIAGAQDNGTKRFTGNPQAWTTSGGGDGGYCASDPTDPNFFYWESQNLAIVRSSNGGVSGTGISSGIGDAGGSNTNFIPYFMLDPNNPNRMLASGRRLWRTNAVKTGTPVWTSIKPTIEPPPLTQPPREPPGSHMVSYSPWNISTIAVAEGNPDIIWVGYNVGQVWKTTNGTAATPTWTRLDNGVNPLPARWVARIVIDPANHSNVYVAFMGYNTGNVRRTTDGGATWTDASGSGPGALPAVPVSALAKHRTAPGRLYAGTDLGLFQTTNSGATWSPINPGVGLVAVDELVWKNDTTLMAVTHGRGVFLGDITVAACYPDCNGDAVLNLADFGCFQTNFASGNMYADCNGDTLLDLADFGCFMTKFAIGCP